MTCFHNERAKKKRQEGVTEAWLTEEGLLMSEKEGHGMHYLVEELKLFKKIIKMLMMNMF